MNEGITAVLPSIIGRTEEQEAVEEDERKREEWGTEEREVKS